MADIKTLESAFMKAHQAGDTKAAASLAAEIKRMRAQGGADPQQVRAELSAMTPSASTRTVPQRMQAEYDALPEYEKPFVAAQDLTVSAMDALSLGWLDEALAKGRSAVKGVPYEEALGHVRRDIEGRKARAGWAGTAASILAGGGALSGLMKAAPILNPASLAAKTLVGAGTGATLGGLEGAGREEEGNRLEGGKSGAQWGAAIGAAAPVVAKGAGTIYEALARRIRPALPELGRRGSAIIEKSAADVPPGGARPSSDMLFDQSPSLTQLAQGTAALPGKGKDELVKAIMGREAGRSNRLMADTERAVGPYVDPEQLAAKIAASRQATAGPLYTAAKQNAPAIDTPALRNTLAQQLTEPAKSMALPKRAAMAKVFDEIDDALRADDPTGVASRLHSLRKSLDARINYADRPLGSEAKEFQDVWRNARDAIDDVLKNRLGFDKADEIAAQTFRQQEALERGGEILMPSKAPYAPNFAREVGVMPAAETAPLRAGTAADIYRAMGTSPNDLAALKRKVGGENDWNRANLETLFGKKAVDDLVGAVQRETGYARRATDIVAGSQTSARQQAAAFLKQAEAPRVPNNPVEWPVAASRWLLRKGGQAVMASRNEALRDKIANALGASGPEMDRILALARKGRGGEKIAELARALLLGNTGQMSNALGGGAR